MRYNIKTKHSTYYERVMYEALKEAKASFKHRWIVAGREVDFVVGKYTIEINGHEQDTVKNEVLAQAGYIPVHLHNSEVNKENITKLLNKIL